MLISGQGILLTQIPTTRRGLAAAELNGSIYVCGGWNGTSHLSVCERYEQRINQWQTMASMKRGRYCFSLVAANGHLFAVGGHGEAAKTVEMYDPEANDWTLLARKLTEKRWECSAVVLSSYSAPKCKAASD